MKKYICYIVIFAAMSSLLSAKSPKLEFDCGKSYDFGNVRYQKNELECTIKLKNSGDTVLVINKAKPSCGCTKLGLTDSIIEPGGYSELQLKLNISRKNGYLKKKVVFHTNDSTTSPQILYLTADVNTGFILRPRRLDINNAILGKESNTYFEFENASEEVYHIDSITVIPKELTIIGITENMKIQPEQRVMFNVSITPTVAARRKAKIILHSSSNSLISDVIIPGIVWSNVDE
jgi:hypothetical protein